MGIFIYLIGEIVICHRSTEYNVYLVGIKENRFSEQ